jgi:metallo-beta-lactamase family protein
MNRPFGLIHYGADNCVTGSCHMITALSGVNILIDCGLSMGSDPFFSLDDFACPVNKIDYLFLTHAHLDHIGRIPELIEKGFSGEIICTHATKELLIPMLEDSMSFGNRTQEEKKALTEAVEDLSWGFEYNNVFFLKKQIKFRLKNAGHILGSAFIEFGFPVNEKSGDYYSVTFSGDLGSRNTPILPDPSIPGPCNLLVLESTYGDRMHENRENRISSLGKLINQALEDSGKIIIPAFSLGRTQELIYEADRLFTDKIINEKIPVFIDSPLGLKITEIYSRLSRFWDSDSAKLLKKGDHPIDFDNLYAVESFRAHKKLVEYDKPCIIIAGSGMCTGGRVVSHLLTTLEDKKNEIFFCGYQAAGTLGRDIIRYSKKTNGYCIIDDKKVPIHAKVFKLSGYSAHADKKGLVSFVNSVPGKPEKIKLVHGEKTAADSLGEFLDSCGYTVVS